MNGDAAAPKAAGGEQKIDNKKMEKGKIPPVVRQELFH